MISLKVVGNNKALLAKLKDNQKQINFALAVALTKTAQTLQAQQYGEIKKVFDRPTPYSLNSLYVKPATKVIVVIARR